MAHEETFSCEGKRWPCWMLCWLATACSGRVAHLPAIRDGGVPSEASVVKTPAPDASVAKEPPPVGSAPPPRLGHDASTSVSEGPPPVAPTDGRCELTPRMLVSATSLPTVSNAGPVDVGFGWLFATGSTLYFSTYVVQSSPGSGSDVFRGYVGGSAMRVPVEGGAVTELMSGSLFSRPLPMGRNLIFVADSVPASHGSVILSLPLAGGPATTFAMLHDEEIVSDLGTDGTNLYFSETTGIKAILGVPDSGSADVISLVPGLSANIIGALGDELFFAYPQGQVESMPLPPRASSPVALLGSCPAGPTNLVPCGANACWIAGTNTIEQLEPGGAPAAIITLTGTVSSAFDAAYDAAYAYIVSPSYDYSENFLERVPLDGSRDPVIIARMPHVTDPGQPSVAVDDECIYWSNTLGIFSVTKTAVGIFEQ